MYACIFNVPYILHFLKSRAVLYHSTTL